MRMSRGLVLALKVIVGLVMVMVLTPLGVIWALSIEVAAENPEAASLRWPELLFVAGLIACFEVVCLAILKLLSRVRDDAIFDPRAFFWVNVMIWSGLVAVALLAFAFVPLLAAPVDSDAPGLPLMLLFGIGVVTGFVLLMIVMRGLLVQATEYRAELQEVI